jgi:hypothetical protein
MLRINFVASEATIAAFRAKGSQIVRVLQSRISLLMQQLGAQVVQRVSGQMVGVRTGKVRASITINPTVISGTRISGSVSAGGDPLAGYAVFVERGSRMHQVLASRQNFLKFVAGGKTRFAKSVSVPAISPKPFMALTQQENKARIFSELEKAIADVTKE